MHSFNFAGGCSQWKVKEEHHWEFRARQRSSNPGSCLFSWRGCECQLVGFLKVAEMSRHRPACQHLGFRSHVTVLWTGSTEWPGPFGVNNQAIISVTGTKRVHPPILHKCVDRTTEYQCVCGNKMSIKVGVGGKVHTRDFHRLFTQGIRVWVRVKLTVNGDRFMEAVEVNHDLPKSNK